jgi:hypothetical protein
MLRRIPKVFLLVALLAAFAASIAPAFGRSSTCGCYILKGDRIFRPREDVISTKKPCSASVLAAGNLRLVLSNRPRPSVR